MLTIGLLGGTFDPFHNGHLQLARAIYTSLQLEKIYLIPAAQSRLRDPPVATAEQRLAMVEMVAQDYPWLAADAREINRGGTSYTIDTLKSYRAQMPDTSVCFIMSMDQFLQFDRWHAWQQIPELAHLIIATRPGYSPIFNASIDALIQQRHTDDRQLLHQTPAGFIFFQSIAALPISGTDIRKRLKAGENAADLVPEKVEGYLREQKLYV